MVRRRDIGSWLDGPGVASGTSQAFPGERFGRPQTGPGSLGRPGRRLLGIAVDWLVAVLVARTFLTGLPPSLSPLVVLFVEQVLLVGTAGFSIGHRIVGLRIEAVDGTRASLRQVVIRSALLVLAIPALVWDADQRGLHDKAAGTLVARN